MARWVPTALVLLALLALLTPPVQTVPVPDGPHEQAVPHLHPLAFQGPARGSGGGVNPVRGAALPPSWPASTLVAFNNTSVDRVFSPADGDRPAAAIFVAPLHGFILLGGATIALVNESTREVVSGMSIPFANFFGGIYDNITRLVYAMDGNYCGVQEVDPFHMVKTGFIALPCNLDSVVSNNSSGAVYVASRANGCVNNGLVSVINASASVPWNVTVNGTIARLAVDPLNGTVLFSGENLSWNGFNCVQSPIFGWFRPGAVPGNATIASAGATTADWITFSLNGTRVFATDDGGHIDAYSTASFQKLASVPFNNQYGDGSLAMNPITGDLVASSISAFQIEIVDPWSMKIVRNLTPAINGGYTWDAGNQSVLAVDPATGVAFAPNSATGYTFAATGNGSSLYPNILTGAELISIATDPIDHISMATDSYFGEVYFINDSTEKVIRTECACGQGISGPTLFNSRTRTFEDFSSIGGIYYPTNGTFLESYSPSDCPEGAAFTTNDTQVWVNEPCDNRVAVYNATSLSWIRAIRVNSSYDAGGMAFDPVHGRMYVSLGRSVLVVNVSNYANVTTINLGRLLAGMDYSGICGCVYVALSNGDRIERVSTATNRVVSNATSDDAQAVTDLDALGYVLGADTYSSNLTVLNATSGQLLGIDPVTSAPTAISYDPGLGRLLVASSDGAINFVNVSLPFPTIRSYTLTFHETGLGAQPRWWVALNGTNESSTTSVVVFNVTNGTYAYQVGIPPGFGLNGANGSVTVNGTNLTVSLRFYIPGFTYHVSFNEAGLPSGTKWSIEVNGSVDTGSSPTISLLLPNASYQFTVVSVVGYQATPTSGNVSVRGANTSVAVQFSPVLYAVQFTETGLPLGEVWNVTVGLVTNQSSSSVVGFTLPNGSYTYRVGGVGAYLPSLANGTLQVAGQQVTVVERFTATTTYPVQFVALGLPSGSMWSVSLGQFSLETNRSAISVREPNGSYTFTVFPPAGWIVRPTSGSFSVPGAAVSVDLQFGPSKLELPFEGEGLPGGLVWSVTVVGTGAFAGEQSNQTTGGELVFRVAAGFTGTFSVSPPRGFSAFPSGGTLAFGEFSDPAPLVVHFSTTVPALEILAVTASPSTMTVDQPLTISVNATGGAPPLTYAYSGLPPGCGSANRTTLTCDPASAGNFTVQVIVTDSLHTMRSANLSLIVVPATSIQNLNLGLPSFPWFWASIAIAATAGVALLAARTIGRRKRPLGEGSPTGQNLA